MANRAKINRLEKKITALSDALAHLSSAEDLRELILLIRKPGWTTPAEYALVTGTVDSMLGFAQVLTRQKAALLKGSKAVGLR